MEVFKNEQDAEQPAGKNKFCYVVYKLHQDVYGVEDDRSLTKAWETLEQLWISILF